MANYKIKLFAILIMPMTIQSAAINYDQQLIKAAKVGNIDQVKEALANGANINFVDAINKYHQNTPLHYAAKYGHIEIVNALILAKATIDARDADHMTLLHFAAMNGYTEIVNALILANAAIDARDNNQWASLHFAAINGHIKVVNSLILAKANINVRNDYLDTPLHLVVFRGLTEALKLLLNVGADSNLLNKDNRTIFDLITENFMINQNKKDQLSKIIKDHQEYQSSMFIEIPQFLAAQQNQLKIPVPIAKLITQYAFGICETEDSNKKEGDKQ